MHLCQGRSPLIARYVRKEPKKTDFRDRLSQSAELSRKPPAEVHPWAHSRCGLVLSLGWKDCRFGKQASFQVCPLSFVLSRYALRTRVNDLLHRPSTKPAPRLARRSPSPRAR
jgi:hypothetical protein